MNRRRLLTTLAVIAAGVVGFQIGLRQSGTQGGNPPADERPLIGIASLTSDTYIRALREAGGIPVVLPNTDFSEQVIVGYLSRLDALLLPGGADIPPSEYGEDPHETVKILADDRFNFEKAMGGAWIGKTDKPMLGICLGGQWINVLHGGSLVQDIPSEFNVNHRGVAHKVTLEPGSRLAGVIGRTEIEVNSLHHQAVRDVGEGLRAVAHSPGGIVEAIESSDPDRFLIGVQWHPEKMAAEDEGQARLIRAFVEAARQARRSP